MHSEKLHLAYAFLQAEPAAVARLLEGRPANEVAAFIAHAPHNAATNILHYLLAPLAAEIVVQLEQNTAIALLQDMAPRGITRVLRHVPNSPRNTLLEALPLRQRSACTILLRYPETAIGAWIETELLCSRPEASVGEVLAQLRRRDYHATIDKLYLIDQDHHLCGVIGLSQVLKTADSTLVRSIAQAAPGVLGSRTSLRSALNSPLWQQQDSVAVVNRNRELIGVLRHNSLRRALTTPGSSQQPHSQIVSQLSQAYGHSMLALLDTLRSTTQS